MQKEFVLLDKPIYMGMYVLDISKTLMFEFYYETIKQRYNDRAKLLFTDTQSLCYFIDTDILENDRLEDIHKYEKSNYSQAHNLYSEENKNIGKTKDDTYGKQIEEFVSLRPKLYCFRTFDEKEKKQKELKKYHKEKYKMEESKQALFHKNKIYKKMTLIQSKEHNSFTYEVNRIAISSGKDKRHILKVDVSTLALGHGKLV